MLPRTDMLQICPMLLIIFIDKSYLCLWCQRSLRPIWKYCWWSCDGNLTGSCTSLQNNLGQFQSNKSYHPIGSTRALSRTEHRDCTIWLRENAKECPLQHLPQSSQGWQTVPNMSCEDDCWWPRLVHTSKFPSAKAHIHSALLFQHQY